MPSPIQRMLALARERFRVRPDDTGAPESETPDRAVDPGADAEADAYASRIAHEQAVYAGQTVVHDLPAIFHYWSNRYLRPRLEAFGFSHPEDFFLKYAARTLRDRGSPGGAVLSIGSGNCDAEVRLAQGLREAGFDDFVIDCVDINPQMLERGRLLADEGGVARHIRPVAADFNTLQLTRRYDVVVANQALHHVMALEHLFDEVSAALPPHGRFLVSDMIGRNGHLRWPEALTLVHALWAELPEPKKYNHQLRRVEATFEDWDCSGASFEGIRAQDILPCLIPRFRFELFIGFINIVDVFIGRGFGPNFDADSEADRAIIDKVHAVDEAALLAGRIKPTHAILVARSPAYAGETRVSMGLTPAKAVRDPAAPP